MSAAPLPTRRAASPDRRDAFARYAVLLERQLAALDADDLGAFGQLADARDALAREVDTALPPADAEAELPLLERCLDLDQQLRARLRALRDRAAHDLRELDSGGTRVRRYLRPPAPGQRLDLRS